MSVNQSARLVRLLIGGQDWSSALLEISNWSTTPLSQSGLVTTTCTISLISVRSLPGSLDDRVNPVWRVGQKVEIFTTDSTGAFRKHPAGAQRILAAEYDDEQRRLTVNCGCLITLLNYRAPTTPETAEIEIGTFTSRSTIVSKLLTAAGITSVSNPFSLPHPLNYPISIGGSYLECLGKLLYSAGFCSWINSNETFCIKPINILGSATLTLKIGGDDGEELWYRRLRGGEGPREIIKVVGTTKVAQPSGFPSNNTATRYGDAIAVDPSLSGLVVISSEEIEENYGNFTKTTKTQTLAPIGMVLPTLNYAGAGQKLALIPSESKVEKRKYEGDAVKGKLISYYAEISKPIGVSLADYYFAIDPDSTNVVGLQNLFLSEIIDITYSYDSKNRPTQVATKKYESLGALLAGTDQDWEIFATPPTGLRLSETTEETWAEQRKGEWVHEIKAYKTLARLKPELAKDADPNLPNAQELLINQKLSLIADSSASIRETSNSGQQTPPAPEQRPPDANFEDEQITGEAQFSQFGGNTLQERERTFQIDYLEGKEITSGTNVPAMGGGASGPVAQCNKLAQLEGQLLYGRFKGQDIGLNLRDELFNWEPLMRVNCIEADGTNRAYALDDSHWFLGQDKALCNFGGILIGNLVVTVLPVPVTTTGTSVPVTVFP